MTTSRSPHSPDESFRFATFSVGKDLFAIDIMRIREIVRPLAVTPVPKAPRGMVGVVDLRGEVLPLFDLRIRFELPTRNEKEQLTARQLIVRLDGRTLGLLVDAMHDVITVRRSQLRVGPGVLSGEAAEVFLGVCPVGDRLALLLNLRRVLTRDDRIAMDAILEGTPP
jgi:purine-binding chemotaxis protein CheW